MLNFFSYRVAMSHLKRKRERWTVKLSFHGDRGKIHLVFMPLRQHDKLRIAEDLH